jgi:hypothetical protein
MADSAVIPVEAVEAAAQELSKAAYGGRLDWATLPDGPRFLFLRDARAALEAALPLLQAAP